MYKHEFGVIRPVAVNSVDNEIYLVTVNTEEHVKRLECLVKSLTKKAAKLGYLDEQKLFYSSVLKGITREARKSLGYKSRSMQEDEEARKALCEYLYDRVDYELVNNPTITRKTRIYNVLTEEKDFGKKGMCLTDKELLSLRAEFHDRLGATKKAHIYTDSIYYFFGARFGTVASWL